MEVKAAYDLLLEGMQNGGKDMGASLGASRIMQRTTTGCICMQRTEQATCNNTRHVAWQCNMQQSTTFATAWSSSPRLYSSLAFRRSKIAAPLPCDPCFPREPGSSGGPVFMAGEIANVASKVAESIAKRMSLPGLP
jgi:hypothetical protein